MSTHKDHHFSITVYTSDLAVLYCLRALADYSQETGNTRIPWGGTTKEDWKRDKQCVTFRFSEPTYRSKFVEEASRILPNASWSKVKESDNDPAVPPERKG